MQEKILHKVLAKLAKIGDSDVDLRANSQTLADLWNQKQELIKEMNVAKKQAAEEAAKPYLQAINKIEQNYTMILKLSTGASNE